VTPLRVIGPLEWPKEVLLKIHHRGTEDTEDVVFSLAGRRRPGKRASASGESSLAGSNRSHQATGLLDRARRAAIFCPIKGLSR
jgi:hypothetical protein